VSQVVTQDPYRWKATSRWRRARDWARWELVGLQPSMDLAQLVLDWTDRRVRDLEARGAITGITLERTIEGASNLTVTLRDPDGQLFSRWAGRTRDIRPTARQKRSPVEIDEGWDPILGPNTIGKAMEVHLDGVIFRLVGAAYRHSDREITLTFEDRIAYLLKRKRGERRASRANVTRAQFVLSLLREVKLTKPPFVCPELMVRQPIGKQEKTVSTPTDTSGGDPGGGFPPAAKLTVKGRPASAAQRKRMDGILAEAASLGASEDVMAACLACATQESVMGENAGTTGNDDMGLMQQGRNWIPASDVMNPRLVTNAFLLSGTPDAKGKGQAPGWKKKHGSLKSLPGGFDRAIKAVQVSVGGYGPWEQEARAAVKAWGGPSGGGDAAGASDGGDYTKSYQYAREPDEDSWTAIQRLAEEVGWRFFVVGQAVYFMSEEQLFKRRPRYELKPDSPAVLELGYDVDWGKPVSECTVTVSLDHWGAPPGAVMLLSGFGPPDGRWLVTGVRRDWFAPTAEVTLKQPGKQKLEPASERASRAANTSDGVGANETSTGSQAEQLYAACKDISDKAYPYVWGGGHGQAGTPSGGTGRDPGTGYDCSGSVCAALAKTGLGYRLGGPVDTSGTMAGKGIAGKGEGATIWANGGHVWVEFHLPGKQGWRFDTSPHGDNSGRGPRVRSTPRSDQGRFSARHFSGM
jgi:hypothetical protein